MPVSLRKAIYGIPKFRALHPAHDRSRRVRATVVLDDLPKLRRTFLRGERLVEACGSTRHGVLDLHFIRRGPRQLDRELVVGASHLADLLAHVDGNPDGLPFVGNSPLDSLTYPPRSVGGEAEAAVRVELLDGPHEADVALLDQILEGEAVTTQFLGYGDDELQ